MVSLKSVVVGDADVGKTCVIVRFTTGVCPGEFICGVGADDHRSLLVDGEPINLNVYDTAAAEDYDRLRPLKYDQTDIFLVCFSVASRTSFDRVSSKWIPEITHHCPNVPFVLCGLKTDLRCSNKQTDSNKCEFVSFEEGEKKARELGTIYLECSARTGDGVDKLFEEVVRVYLHKDFYLQKDHGRCIIM